ncbi:MAG: protein-L-isoaspartate(D-aspartate) O-methyltransferase [Bacteroidota bacterium]|nr:protein-L-isoaspartate(D-aspartate) O-methyltransferase [Bacteroidota bacterium]
MEDNYKHKGMRKALIKIIKDKGIKDERVLEAINKVPRHFFFENAFLEHAYQDKAFPIGEGQTISQPYTVAFQTELLNLKNGGESVLEIGTGSGYQSCILLELGVKLYTIEYNKNLYEKVKRMLPRMGYKANFFWGDGSKGLVSYAPFNKILVTAGAPFVPSVLIEQLKEGGSLVIPVGNNKTQRMLRFTKEKENKIIKEEFDNFSFVPLLGEHGWK